MKKKTKLLIFIYLIIVISLAIIIYVVPSVTGWLTPTVVLEYGNLTDTDRQECYFVRDEKVYLAGTTGDLNYYFDEGVKLKKNTAVLSISANGGQAPEESVYQDLITKLGGNGAVSSDCRTEFKGVVSYFIDGYEAYFTPDKILGLNYEEVKHLDIDEPINLTRTAAFRNEPIYKISQNENWYATCWVSDGNIAKYEQGKEVILRLPLGDVEAVVTSISDKGEMWQVVFETDRYYEDFSKIRKEEIDIVTSDYNGLIVPNRSIATHDGQPCVYVKQTTGEYEFVPINIIGSDGEYSVVSESYYYDGEGQKVNTVITYDEILKNPETKNREAE